MKENRFKENGITLVALVVTIIFLLILAGVAISNLLGENGLIKQTKVGKEKYAISEAKEKIELEITNLQVEQQSKGEGLTKEILTKINNEDIDVRDTSNFPVEVICGKYKFEVDNNFQVKYIGEATGTIIKTIIEPSTYTNKDEVTIYLKIKNIKGLNEVECPNGNKINVEGKKEEEISYTVNKNGKYTFIVRDNQNKEETKEIYIDKIDKLAPLDFEPEIEINGNKIKVKQNAKDADATEESSKSGIDYYELYLNGVKQNNIEDDNLQNGEYKIYVIAYDKAGNYKKSTQKTINITITSTRVVASGYRGMVIDTEGYAYIWGRNTNTTSSTTAYYLINNIKYAEYKKSIKILDKKIKDFAIKKGSCILIDEDGQMWSFGDAWGYNNGQSVHPTSDIPKEILNEEKFTKVSMGDQSYCIAIDEDGNLWSWGQDEFGQQGLGRKLKYEIRKPQKITEKNKFTEICAGGIHNLAIDEDGNLYSWGYNELGQLGNGTTVTDYSGPKLIEQGIKFKKISAGSNHSVAIDVEGNLYSWGYNAYGQLGDGTNNNSSIPKIIMQGTKFKDVGAGAERSYALDVEGNLYAWGYNRNGELGDGTTKNSNVPIKIVNKSSISNMWTHSGGIYYIENNKLYGLGVCLSGYGGNIEKKTKPYLIE